MKTLFPLTLTLILSCEGWYGKPVPLGDEFEDHWHVLDSLQEQIVYLCPSYTDSDCFFAISRNRIWRVKETPVQVASFGEELTCIASSFSQPEQLLCGTASSNIILVDTSGNTSIITVPGADHISHVAFDPGDSRIIYAGSGNRITKRDSAGTQFDTILDCPDIILDFVLLASGNLYIATAQNVLLSADQGINWDTIFLTTGAPIAHITCDQQGYLYVNAANAVYRANDNANWHPFFEDTAAFELMTGIEAGIMTSRRHAGVVEVKKITGSGQCCDISYGILAPFGFLDIRCATNGNKYLLSNSHLEQPAAVLFYFSDTELPP